MAKAIQSKKLHNMITSSIIFITSSKLFMSAVREYTYKELANMHLTCIRAKRNGCKARRLYKQCSEIHHIPSHPTFSSVDWRLQEINLFAISNRYAGHLQNAQIPEMEERVWTKFEIAPCTSTRAVAYKMGIFQPVVLHIVHEECMYPCYMQKVHSLQTDDHS